MLDALRLSFDVLFDTTLWSVVPVVALVAVGAALVWGDRRVAAFLAVVLGLVFLGGAWVTFAFRELPITAEEALNPIVRYTGAVVLLAAVVEGLQLPMREWRIWQPWPFYLLVPLGAFLLLQFLQLAIKRDAPAPQ